MEMRYRRFGSHRIVTNLELCEEDFKLLLGLLSGIGFRGPIVEEASTRGITDSPSATLKVFNGQL